jgi:hypothetical protein
MALYRVLPFATIFSFFVVFTGKSQTGEVRGFLYDSKTGEPVLFSPVFLKGTKFGVNTDVNGFFSLSKIPAGNYDLMVVNLLYDTIVDPVVIQGGKILSKKFFLKERIRELQAVEIKGSKNKVARVSTVNASITRITPKEIKHIPPIGGEHDLAQYLQTVPGVVFTGDQGGQLFMRGGSNVQTLTLMDGMMVYNPFHSLGLFSVFDTDILKNIDVYTAAFPSDYGGRASSVIDVKTIDGNKNKIGGRLGINPFSAKAIMEGPIYKGKEGAGITFLASYRNSYLDRSSSQIYRYANQTGNYLPFSFSDAYGKVTFHGDKGSKASIFGFNFQDRAKLGKLGNFAWNSSGAGGNFLVIPSSTTVLISGNFAYSNYDVKIEEASILPRKSTISNLNGGLDFTYFFNKNELKYGAGIVTNTTTFTSYNLEKEERLIQANNSELYGFAKFKYNPIKRLILEPNLRVHYYASLSVIRLEPRFGAKYGLTDKIRLKAAAGMYSQNLVSTQSDRDVIALFQGFISSPDQVYSKNESTSSNPNNKPIKSPIQKSVHLVAGIEYDINDDFEITLEPYIKQFNDFVNVNRNQTFPVQPLFITESSLAKGIDFIFKYEREPIFIQASYSIAKVDRKFDTLVYAPVFDRRHNVNLVCGYNFGKKKDWEFNVRWNLGSGFPFTQTVAFYENQDLARDLNQNINSQNGSLGIYYGREDEFNRGRQPYYHRLDVSISKKWDFANGSKLEALASIVNSYNRENVFYFDRVLYQRINQLPILPALGVNYQF